MRLFAAVCCAVLFASAAFAQSKPQNLDFESGAIGQPPPGWKLAVIPATSHATLVARADDPYAGHAYARLTLGDEQGVAGMIQEFDAAPYRGKLVLLRAAMRLHSKDDAGLWVAFLDAKGNILSGRNIDNGTVHDGSWRVDNKTFVVPRQAAKIGIHFNLFGAGTLDVSNVSVADVTPEQMHYEGPQPLTDHGLANLEALTRLIGYVRFFHPSDQAANADWNAVAIDAVHKVEGAKDSAELAQTLRNVFLPLAPTLRIYETGTPPPELVEAAPPEGAEIVAWVHHGVRLSPKNDTYSSERVTLKSPEQPWRADLPGGVSVVMPLSLYRDKDGTLPHEANPGVDALPQFTPSGLDRATRLADIALAWSIYKNFYPNFDYTPVDWSEELSRTLREAAIDATPEKFLRTLEKMVASVRDGHGFVQLDAQISRWLPLRWDWVQDHVVILAAAPSTGLHAGDVVEKYNGRPVQDVIAQDIDPIVSASTPQHRKVYELYWLAMNDGSPVILNVRTATGAVVRRTLQPAVSFFNAPLPGQPEHIAEVKPGIWYVDLDHLAPEFWTQKLPDLANAKAVIFDMRGYPTAAEREVLAHLTDKPIHSGQFDVPIYTRPDRQGVTYGPPNWWTIAPTTPRLSGKIIFLTGPHAVSWAESVMGTVAYNHLATIVGSTTAGTNGNIDPSFLPGGYFFEFTGMRVLAEDGSRFFGIGIKPDVPVEPTIAGIRAGHDEVLDKAVAIASQSQ